MFVFAAVGSSVGLGNIWRFPYLVGKYGGGAFLVPYVLLMFLLGLPLLILEFSLGQKMQQGAIGAFRRIHPKAKGVGLASVLCSFAVSCYYAVVISWSLLYFWHSLSLSWGKNTKDFFFREILQVSPGPGVIGDIPTDILVCLVLCWVIVYFCIWKGVKSVSRVVAVTMPLPIILLIILLIRVVLLPGAGDGLLYFLRPDFFALLDGEVWMAAMSQVFFSLTLGFGVMIAYGSYQNRTSDVVKNATIITIADLSIALLSGLVVFSTLGYMAEESGQSVSELAASGLSLAFIVFPKALSLIPGAPFFAALFFITLISLGIDSLFSLVESITSVFSDRFFHIRKQDLVLYVCIACFAGGIIFTTAGGIYYLDIVDHFITSFGLVAVALMEALVIGWGHGAEKFRSWAASVSDWHLGQWWNGTIRYFVPVALSVLLITSFYRNLTIPYEGYPIWALFWMGWMMLVAISGLSLAYSLKRWSVTGSNR